MIYHDSFSKYLDVLGLQPDCSSFDIEQSYKFMALAFHPDRFPPKWRPLATERMRQIIEARDALKNHSPQPTTQATQKTVTQRNANYTNPASTSPKSSAGLGWKPTFVEKIELCGAGCLELFIQEFEPAV
ncbi:MAG: J domain-containing protein, partial [Candidatus Obscuribacterales bacterium]|nr:J domain-containing protein [Candidatus Obscuribacterales bacterium]